MVAAAKSTCHKPDNSSKNNNRRNFGKKSSARKTDPKLSVVCQFCEKQGHAAKQSYKIRSHDAVVNCVTSNDRDKKLLLDSTTLHNITSNISNVYIHFEYDGQDEVVLGDDTGLVVTHVGSKVSLIPLVPLC